MGRRAGDPAALTRAPGVDASVEAAVADAHRREWAFVLAATVRVTRDIDLAEECVQDAYAQALSLTRHLYKRLGPDRFMSAAELDEFRARMREKNIQWAIAGPPVEFRKDEEQFAAGLKELPAFATTLEKAGVPRVTTKVGPGTVAAARLGP